MHFCGVLKSLCPFVFFVDLECRIQFLQFLFNLLQANYKPILVIAMNCFIWEFGDIFEQRNKSRKVLGKLDERTINIVNTINTLLCPSKSKSKRIELTVHTFCYWGLRLNLC